MKKLSNICIILISIFNIYKIIDCYIWINSTTFWGGGLGAAEIYIWGFILALVLQILNILLAIFLLKHKEKNKFIWISLLIIVGTFLIPMYKFPILYPYNNLYNMAIFKI